MSAKSSAVNEVLVQRVRSEFLEMPGLRLTCQQAQRLWGLDEWLCLQVLDALVDSKFLFRSTHGMYARVSDGRAPYPQFRMVKSRIEADRSHTKKEAV